MCERVNLPGCMPLSLALSSSIKPATLQQYGAINYRHAAISAKHAGEERQEHINRTNGHIKDQEQYRKLQTTSPTPTTLPSVGESCTIQFIRKPCLM